MEKFVKFNPAIPLNILFIKINKHIPLPFQNTTPGAKNKLLSESLKKKGKTSITLQ